MVNPIAADSFELIKSIMKLSKQHYGKKTVVFSLLLLIALSGVFLQFKSTPLEYGPVTGKVEAPKEIVAILERSCFNCHSNENDLHWYEKIVPVSWLVNKDIKRAREIMNFSEWDKISRAEHIGKMWAVLNMVKADKMPLANYRILHPGSKVTESEIQTIKKYVLEITENQTAKPSNLGINYHEAAGKIAASKNGVIYTDEFKKWKAISSSTLYENSMRVIYGNDIAVKAIEEENFHPWPDGAVVVKAVWEQVRNQYGEVRPGKFINAQFMVKDAARYKDTEGWGFAKFSTPELIPTGKTALFAAQSCIGCHRQLAGETGFLFSVPLKVNPKN